MAQYTTLVSLGRKHRWSFDGRTHYEYQIKIIMRDRRVRLSAYPDAHIPPGVEVRVETPPPGLPRFSISHPGLFGADSLEVGVPSFDQEHNIRSPEPDELRRVWTAERCQFARERLADMTAHATHALLIVKLDHSVHDDTKIVHALELALDLAHSDVYGIAALRALPEAVLRQDGGPHVELPGPEPIVIRPVRDDDRVFTKASMQGELPELPPSTWALGSATLAREGNLITVSWPAIEEDPHHLMAAVELLRTLSSGLRDGAYR